MKKVVFWLSTIGTYLVIFGMNFIGLYVIKIFRFNFVLDIQIVIIAAILTLYGINRDLSWLREKYQNLVHKEGDTEN